jgi:hypothetical protein
MTRELDNLVAQRQLKAEPSSAKEVEALLKRSATALTDARREDLAPASRFSLAYDAAFALASAALRLLGYRADVERGHRAVVFMALPHSVEAPPQLWSALVAAHRRRNAVEYTSAIAASTAEVADLLEQVKALDSLVRKAAAR